MSSRRIHPYAAVARVSLWAILISIPLRIGIQRLTAYLAKTRPGLPLPVPQQPATPVETASPGAKISVPGLTESAATLLIPLFYRAQDSQSPTPLLGDAKALEIVQHLDYDFSRIRAKALSEQGALLRAKTLDCITAEFLAEHPNAIVVDIGCGLDTRFFRTDNEWVTWFDLDLPEVISLRRRLLGETSRHKFIGQSVLDYTWMDAVAPAPGQPVLFVAEAVFPYLSPENVRALLARLASHFPGSEIVFDGVPPAMATLGGRWHPSLWHTQASIRWGMGQANKVLEWNPGIQLAAEYPYYLEDSSLVSQMGPAARVFAPFFRDFKIVHFKLGSPSKTS